MLAAQTTIDAFADEGHDAEVPSLRTIRTTNHPIHEVSRHLASQGSAIRALAVRFMRSAQSSADGAFAVFQVPACNSAASRADTIG